MPYPVMLKVWDSSAATVDRKVPQNHKFTDRITPELTAPYAPNEDLAVTEGIEDGPNPARLHQRDATYRWSVWACYYGASARRIVTLRSRRS